MPYIPLLFFQARFWTVWGDLCSIWLDSGHVPLSRPMLVSLGPCHMRNWLHWVLTYTLLLRSTFHFNNTMYPQPVYEPLSHICMDMHKLFTHSQSITMCSVLSLLTQRVPKEMCQVFCAQTLQRCPGLNAVTEIPFQHPAVRDLL